MTFFEIGIFIIIHIIMFVHHLKNTIEASIAETITLINKAVNNNGFHAEN